MIYGNAVSIDGAEVGLHNRIDGAELGVFYNTGGTSDYDALYHKPAINGVTLVGDKSIEELGVETLTNQEILTIFRRVFDNA